MYRDAYSMGNSDSTDIEYGNYMEIIGNLSYFLGIIWEFDNHQAFSYISFPVNLLDSARCEMITLQPAVATGPTGSDCWGRSS